MDDLAIIELYHQREERAIAESELKYGGMCRSIARNILTLREDAEECVNDTWHAAWNRMPPDRPQTLGAFLGRITRNLAISRWRKAHAKKRFSGMEVMLSELSDCLPGSDTVERYMDQKQLSAAISRWLDGLEEGDRALFIRRYWYGDKVQSLAAERKERSNQLSQRLLRLRKKLREALETEGVSL